MLSKHIINTGNRVWQRSFLLAMLAAISAGNVVSAQDAGQGTAETINQLASETTEQDSSEAIDEITVVGQKPLHALRREVYRAEEDFFEVFSAINEDDDYDVRCYYEVPSFTHIRRHVCRAKFVIDATSAESRAFMSEQVGNFSRPATFEIERKKKRLQELMEALIVERPELLQALNKYTNAKQTLESEKKGRK
jgi:hypothetical protein